MIHTQLAWAASILPSRRACHMTDKYDGNCPSTLITSADRDGNGSCLVHQSLLSEAKSL